MINGEGGRIPEESRVDYVMDRMETTGTVWMGLTFTCCRCHDHKFDPLKQREYYSLSAPTSIPSRRRGGNDAGGFANPIFSLATPEQQAKVDEFEKAETKRKERAGRTRERICEPRKAAWEEMLRAGCGRRASAEINLAVARAG